MANFRKGDTVKIATVIPEGPVQSMRMDEDGNVSYLISWTDVDGNTQTRWFDEAQLESA